MDHPGAARVELGMRILVAMSRSITVWSLTALRRGLEHGDTVTPGGALRQIELGRSDGPGRVAMLTATGEESTAVSRSAGLLGFARSGTGTLLPALLNTSTSHELQVLAWGNPVAPAKRIPRKPPSAETPPHTYLSPGWFWVTTESLGRDDAGWILIRVNEPRRTRPIPVSADTRGIRSGADLDTDTPGVLLPPKSLTVEQQRFMTHCFVHYLSLPPRRTPDVVKGTQVHRSAAQKNSLIIRAIRQLGEKASTANMWNATTLDQAIQYGLLSFETVYAHLADADLLVPPDSDSDKRLNLDG